MRLKNAIFKLTKFDHLIADHVEFLPSFPECGKFCIYLNYAMIVNFKILDYCLELLSLL